MQKMPKERSQLKTELVVFESFDIFFFRDSDRSALAPATVAPVGLVVPVKLELGKGRVMDKKAGGRS